MRNWDYYEGTPADVAKEYEAVIAAKEAEIERLRDQVDSLRERLSIATTSSWGDV